MRHRLENNLTDRATIKRREQVGTKNREPVYGELEPVAEAVPCQFDPSSTSYIREDSGEHITRPATVTFNAPVDLREGDTVQIIEEDVMVSLSGASYGDTETAYSFRYGVASDTDVQWRTVAGPFEVRGIERETDHRRGVTVSVEAELERAD